MLSDLVRLELNSTKSKLAAQEIALRDCLGRFRRGPSRVFKSIPFILFPKSTAGQATWRHSLLPLLLCLEGDRRSSRGLPPLPFLAGLPLSVCPRRCLPSERDDRDDLEVEPDADDTDEEAEEVCLELWRPLLETDEDLDLEGFDCRCPPRFTRAGAATSLGGSNSFS